MEKIKAKVDHLLHKDHTTDTTTTGTHNTTHTGATGTHGTHDTTHTSTTPHGNTHSTHTGSDPTGPHDTVTANKLDPRVDSDRVGPAGNTASAGGYGNTHTGTHTGTHAGGLTGNTHGSDPTGPHDSHLSNKADPRVDSDRVGPAGNTAGAGGYGTTGHTGGLTGNTHTGTHAGGLTGNTYGSDPTGPHDSHLGNKADPRVDSDRVGGYGNTTQTEGFGNATGGGLTGTTAHGNHGEHGLTGQGSHLPGPAPNTAGVHKSDLLNKVDPRVDADLDGSKTFGGNKTYGN